MLQANVASICNTCQLHEEEPRRDSKAEQSSTCGWLHKLAISTALPDGFLAVDSPRGQHHGRVVLIHELLGDGTHQAAVHMLGVRQVFCQGLEVLQHQEAKSGTGLNWN